MFQTNFRGAQHGPTQSATHITNWQTISVLCVFQVWGRREYCFFWHFFLKMPLTQGNDGCVASTAGKTTFYKSDQFQGTLAWGRWGGGNQSKDAGSLKWMMNKFISRLCTWDNEGSTFLLKNWKIRGWEEGGMHYYESLLFSAYKKPVPATFMGVWHSLLLSWGD